MKINIEVSCDLTKIIKKQDIPPALTKGVKNTLAPQAKANFDTESYSGAPWQPLKPRTIADRKAKGFPPGPILYRTGKLKNNNIIQQTAEGCIWDWKTPYASSHQFGVPANHLPARPYITGLGNTPEDVQAVENLCQDIVKELGL